MKKLAFMFVAFAAISFASCGNKAAQADAAVEADTVCCDSAEVEVVDSVAVVADSAAVVADSAAVVAE